MIQVVLMIAETDTVEDGNYLRFGNELLRRGYEVNLCFLESIAMLDSKVIARGFKLCNPLLDGEMFPESHRIDLTQSDLLWVLTLGMRHSFLDKMQLLYCLRDHCRIINAIDSLMHFKSKYFLASHEAVFKYPPTFASNDPDELFRVVQTGNGKWIAKPPAGSLGRDVFLITKDDPNVRVILESMTGPESDHYCLLQSYIEEIRGGEKRVLIAGGVPVGQYIRQATKDHRTNQMHGADIAPCELTKDERLYCERIGQFLVSHGTEFVGVDLAFPYVIEFNVVNPGGLLTIESLTGTDLTSVIIDRIIDRDNDKNIGKNIPEPA